MDFSVQPERWERESGSIKGVRGKGNVWQVICEAVPTSHLIYSLLSLVRVFCSQQHRQNSPTSQKWLWVIVVSVMCCIEGRKYNKRNLQGRRERKRMYEMYRLQKGMVWLAEKGTEKYRFEEKNTTKVREMEGNGTAGYSYVERNTPLGWDSINSGTPV